MLADCINGPAPPLHDLRAGHPRAVVGPGVVAGRADALVPG
jgi:hypothetical protein